MRQCTKKRVPVSGTFELTSRCNFNCKMCYIHAEGKTDCLLKQENEEKKLTSGYENDPEELTADEWIALGKTAKDHQMLFLLLTGGEPLMRKDFKVIYDALYQMGLLISINTNGSLWTPELIDWMKKRPPLQINVTLYGNSRETYGKLCGCPEAFDKVRDNILRMKQAGLHVRINVTVTRLNVDDVEGILAFAKKNDLAVNGTSYLFPANNTDYFGRDNGKNYRLDAEQAGIQRAKLIRHICTEDGLRSLVGNIDADVKTNQTADAGKSNVTIGQIVNQDGKNESLYGQRMKCSAGRSSFWVTWDGKMFPCGMISSVAVSLRGMDFAAVWERLTLKTDLIRLPAKCTRCTKGQYCMICGAAALAEGGGDAEQIGNYMCRMTDACMKSLVQMYFTQINQLSDR